VKLNKLVINNFLSVMEATLYLADKGLVSIEGINEDATGSDSNGAGKSTIINAILWCCYGEAGKKIKADSVVNKKAKKNCLVSTEWQDEDKTYRITRYRKHSISKNAVTVEIQTETGWQDITKAGATNVQEQINRVLGQDLLTFEASCFAQQREQLDIPAMTDKSLKDLLERVLPFEDLNEQHAKATVLVHEQERLIQNLKDKIIKLTWEMDSAKKKAGETLTLFNNYGAQIKTKNAEIESKIQKKKDAIRVASHGLTSLPKVEDELALVNEAIEDLGDTNVGRALALEEVAGKNLKRVQDAFDSPDINCPTCGYETEDAGTYRAKLLPKVEESREALKLAQAKVAEVSAKLAELSELQDEAKLLKDKRYIHLESERVISSLRAEITLLEGQKTVEGSNPYQSPLNTLKGDYRTAKASRGEYNEALEEALEELETREAVQYTYSPKGVRYHMLETVAPRLTESTNKYLQILTDGAVSVTWSTVTKTAAGDYREKFIIDCNYDGEEVEYGSLSGGESRKVKLACFFGLQDVIASKASKNIELWCGDEIDHALDAAGLERLMSVLDAKTGTKSTILVISHNELRDWIPNYAVVTRKNKISTISGYLNEN
jgi:DNA repair exonuclease SbcCD ATPase subunit